MSKTKTLRKGKREKILKRYGSACVWCSTGLDMDSLSIDHVRCVCDQGSDWEGNLLPACKTCNQKRGNKNAHSWLQSCTDRGLTPQIAAVHKAIKRTKDLRSVRIYWKTLHQDRSYEELLALQNKLVEELGVRPRKIRTRSENMDRMRTSIEYVFGRTQHSLRELYEHHPEYFGLAPKLISSE